MTKYTLVGEVTISVYTTVEADSLEKTLEYSLLADSSVCDCGSIYNVIKGECEPCRYFALLDYPD